MWRWLLLFIDGQGQLQMYTSAGYETQEEAAEALSKSQTLIRMLLKYWDCMRFLGLDIVKMGRND